MCIIELLLHIYNKQRKKSAKIHPPNTRPDCPNPHATHRPALDVHRLEEGVFGGLHWDAGSAAPML